MWTSIRTTYDAAFPNTIQFVRRLEIKWDELIWEAALRYFLILGKERLIEVPFELEHRRPDYIRLSKAK
ncbi:MAG: hypothetical protein ACTS7D_00595 [Candidatus Hodgkinia cicadicola]